jgi:hypothetical protein
MLSPSLPSFCITSVMGRDELASGAKSHTYPIVGIEFSLIKVTRHSRELFMGARGSNKKVEV